MFYISSFELNFTIPDVQPEGNVYSVLGYEDPFKSVMN